MSQTALSLRTTVANDSADEIKLVGVARSFHPGQAIYSEGDGAEHLYKVISGAVRVFRMLADGRRQITAFHLAGDIFGIEPDGVRLTTAEAVGPATIVVARRGVADPEQDRRYWRKALLELRRTQDHVLTLGRRSAVEKVASFLMDVAGRLGGCLGFELPMSRQDIADFLGLTIETVSRTFTQLQTRGLISLAGCRHVDLVRPAALVALCE